jgi:hypothetical protein
MKSMRMPALAALGCGVLLAASLAACTTPQACTDVGWRNQLRVHVTGDAAAVDWVTFCDGATCAPPLPPTPRPTPDPIDSTTRDGDVWTVRIDMSTPGTGHLGAYDTAGALLVDQPVALHWTRVGGTAECGGPERAQVTLRIP